MERLIFLFTLIFSVLMSNAQPASTNTNHVSGSAAQRGTIKGRIVEEGSLLALEYANIAIYSLPDSSLISGAIAGPNGAFVIDGLNPGRYYVDAKFIGYEHTQKSKIEINKKNNKVNIGVIELIPASENLQQVNVVAQDRPIVYDIDKKIIDPGQFPTTASGTASDVLANTPSVVVDIEGNITMRGSSNFTVLIDGRPTPFDAADALEQIPASTIRNIEIITNPSAKYDPDGNAGIININTKKSKLTGVSGIINATSDTNGSYGGDFLVNFKNEKFNFFVNGNRKDRKREGEYESTNKSFATNDTIFTISDGYNKRGRSGWSLKTGVDYFINDYNTITLSVGGDSYIRSSDGKSDTHEYSLENDLKSTTEQLGENSGKDISLSLNYLKTFIKKGQELSVYAYYETGNSEDYSLYNRYLNFETGDLINGQTNWEISDKQKIRFKADYIHPFTEDMKLEAGYQMRYSRNNEWNDVNWYTSINNYEPSKNSEYYSDMDFIREIHSLYSTFNQSTALLGYQLGLRAEYTNRSLDYSKQAEPSTINRWDFFPTVHISFQLPADQQIITSYSRRIDRPRGYHLEPFITYTDAYNVRVGNPDIKPEYINSYEIGYQKKLEKGFLSAEIYHRKTINKIERITSIYEDNIMLRTMDNVGEDYSTGLELMLNTNPTKWWMLNLMGNAYHYLIDGQFESDTETETQESFNWHSRISNTFSITPTTKLQFDLMYHSASITAQGRRESFMFTNIAIRKDFFDKKLNATLAVRDLFDTAKFGYISEGDQFYASRKFDIKSPVVSLSLSYKINNYRQAKRKNGENTDGETMDMGGDEF